MISSTQNTAYKAVENKSSCSFLSRRLSLSPVIKSIAHRYALYLAILPNVKGRTKQTGVTRSLAADVIELSFYGIIVFIVVFMVL